tara:strand:- start:118 stop:504 length:387 start_codon:yes stop_codon:yes gene_type:complete
MSTQTRQQKTAQSIDNLTNRIDKLERILPEALLKLSHELKETMIQVRRITTKVNELEADLHLMPVAPTSNMNIVRANVLTTRVTPERIGSRARKARKTKKRGNKQAKKPKQSRKKKQLKRKGSRKRIR